MPSWHEQTEADFRDIERDRDLPPDEPYECYDPEGDWIKDQEQRECDHKWRDYSEFGGDFVKTPIVCRDCGAAYKEDENDE